MRTSGLHAPVLTAFPFTKPPLTPSSEWFFCCWGGVIIGCGGAGGCGDVEYSNGKVELQ